uniref:Aminopeptidase n=1 Tax=Cacopsylla melanoneura TaxID=428564 RepID=A0A8D8TU53_9HEMI
MLNHKSDQNHTNSNNINLDSPEVAFVKEPKFVNLNIRLISVCLGLILCVLLVNTTLFAYKYYECKAASDDNVANDLIQRLFRAEHKESKKKPIDRLPTSIHPLTYKMNILPFIVENNFTFLGEVWITVKVLSPTNNITVHVNDLNITSYAITRLSDKQSMLIDRLHNDSVNQFAVFLLKNELFLPSHEYQLYVKYVGNLNDNMRGLYRSSYKQDNRTRWIVASQFQPTDARRVFPCFDEPAMKAQFTISIGRLSNMTSLSNMPKLEDQVVHADNIYPYQWDHYQQTPLMSTYLVAMAVHDFRRHHNGTFSVWSREEYIDQAKYSLSIGPKIMEYFEEYFDARYPLPKTDMIALPDFSAGAMENFGLITFREISMLYDEHISTTFQKERIATIVSHELAHQWFGNLVTLAWWNDLWLNEGFASYVEYFGVDHVEPSWKIKDIFVVDELQNVFFLDALKSSHPIQVQVSHPDEIHEIFDKISYSKGSSLLRMVDHFLTNGVLRKGLANYINMKAYKSSTQEELWEFLTEAGHKWGTLPEDMSISTIMNTWTLQTGFPVINVTRDYNEGTAFVTQKRFLLEPIETELSENSLWWVPLTFSVSFRPKFNDTKPSHWLRAQPSLTLSKDELMAGDEDWVIFNSQQTGYYRVMYDEKNWRLIIKTLRDPRQYHNIHVLNRAQLIDDSMNLARAGLLSYEIALNVTSYLKHESELVPWRSAINSLGFIEGQLYRKPAFDKYKKYMLFIMSRLYNSTGFDQGANDTQLTIYKRVEILTRACVLGYPDCVSRAIAVYQNWKNNPSNIEMIPVNLKSIILCTGIRWGSSEDWDLLWYKYTKLTIASEKDIYLSALACTSEYWLLSRYLEYSITEGSPIRKQDAPRIFSLVSQNAIGHAVALDFVFNNWERIMKYFIGTQFHITTSILKFCTKRVSSEVELNQLKNFTVANYKDLLSSSRTILQIIENAETNVKWMKKNYEPIVQWLSKTKNYNPLAR